MADVTFTIDAQGTAGQVLQTLMNQFGSLGRIAYDVGTGDIGGAMVTGLNAVIEEGKKAQKVFVDNTDAVRTLGFINGQTAESNSRMVETLDDFKVSAEDALTAQRKLSTQHMTLDIPTIINLAEQYQKLTTGAERQEFMIKNLGRASDQWAEILSSEPDKIRAVAAAQDDLIISQKDLNAAREYQIRLDEIADRKKAAQIKAGRELVDEQLKFFDAVEKGNKAQEEQIRKFDHAGTVTPAMADKLRELKFEEMALLDATDRTAAQWEEQNRAFEFTPGLVADMTDKMDGILGLLDSIQKQDAIGTREWINNQLLKRLSVDGLSTTEYNWYLDYMVQTGQMTEAQRAQAEQIWATVDALAALAGQNISYTVTANYVGNGYIPPPGAGTPGAGHWDYTQHPPVWIPGYAGGGDFVVPPGYSNDSYPMRVSSGEHVTVTPAGEKPAGTGDTYNIYTNNPVLAALEVAHIQKVNRVMQND